MSCEKLVLFYNPKEGKNSLTDLTIFSSNALKKISNQFKQFLYNQEGKFVGELNLTNDTVIYKDTPNITDIFSNYCFTIENDTFVEKYYTSAHNTEKRNSAELVAENSVRFFNLECSVGTQRFTKLKWILPVDSKGKPLTRTLVFYN